MLRRYDHRLGLVFTPAPGMVIHGLKISVELASDAADEREGGCEIFHSQQQVPYQLPRVY